jgi:hypothetical protein
VKFVICLEDGETHSFTHQVVVELGRHSQSVSCPFDLCVERKRGNFASFMIISFTLLVAVSLPLTDRAYHIELVSIKNIQQYRA